MQYFTERGAGYRIHDIFPPLTSPSPPPHHKFSTVRGNQERVEALARIRGLNLTRGGEGRKETLAAHGGGQQEENEDDSCKFNRFFFSAVTSVGTLHGM